MSGDQFSPPWIDGPIRIKRSVIADIEAHAVEAYPSECCGFISGPKSEPSFVDIGIREVNEADKYHRLDPERFPRTSKMYFKINELRASRAFDDGAQDGQPIKIIYHSHCDAGAHFSQEDAATFAQDGVLMWPCQFWVVSVLDGKVDAHKLWRFDPGTNAFVPSDIQICD